MSFVYSIRHIKNTISVFFFQNTGVSVPEHSVLFFFFFLSQGIVPSDQFHEKGLKSKNEVTRLCCSVCVWNLTVLLLKKLNQPASWQPVWSYKLSSTHPVLFFYCLKWQIHNWNTNLPSFQSLKLLGTTVKKGFSNTKIRAAFLKFAF